MKLFSAGKTDTGQVRNINEDSLLLEPEGGLFAVCDGLGGHSAGEVASALAVETIKKYVLSSEKAKDLPRGVSVSGGRLSLAIHEANRLIHQAAASNEQQKGMGSTATAAIFHDGGVSIAHVGDSRAYLFRDKNLEQLTDDHSLVAEQVRDGILTPEAAQKSPYRNVITRALGTASDVEVDVYEYEIKQGDRFLLCTDGLTGVVADAEIQDVIASVSEPQAACDEFVNMANGRGGPDNITVVLIYVIDK